MYNLDEGVVEYFSFVLKGVNYKFRFPNTDEMDAMSKADKEDAIALRKLFIGFVENDGEGVAFEETSKQMNFKHWQKFFEMVSAELGVDASQSPTNT